MARLEVPAILGFYDDPHDLLAVCEKAHKEERFAGLDAYTPYPIHGIEDALGLKPSWVSTVARFGLVIGVTLGFLFQSWTSAVDWPINIGGKPFVSWPAWIPITFECGVLLAGFSNLIAMFVACQLYPRPKTIVLSRRVTNDRFVLAIPIREGQSEERIVKFLKDNAVMKVKVVESVDTANDRVVFRTTPFEVPAA